LRAEIIDAATRLLAGAEEPPLSLRAVTRSIGIAPMSIYLHFKDKRELVLAVIEQRFGELLEACDEAAGRVDTPAGRLRARCLAYCRWGLENPGHYRLLFETGATHQAGIPYERSPGSAVFDSFVAAVRDSAQTDPAQSFQVAVRLWIGLHGIVALRLSKTGFPWPPVEMLVDGVLEAVPTEITHESAGHGGRPVNTDGR
jgi:AcrR family transcriptional regulator